MISSPPPVLSIAGSDCSAGAGIQADLKSMCAMGCYGLTALTSVVSETPGIVSMVQTLPADFIRDQIRVLFEGFPIKAAKMGMVGGIEQIHAVAAAWQDFAGGILLVVDPVMVATGGARLLPEEAIQAVETKLLTMATVMTPNMDEASVLWGKPVASREQMKACASELAAQYGVAVLVKGGHLLEDSAADVLCHEGGLEWFESQRVPGVSTHGTGCSYSAAIASGLAHGLALTEAVQQAKLFVSRAIEQYFEWQSPAGGYVHALNHLQQQMPNKPT